MFRLSERVKGSGGTLMLAGVPDQVRRMLERGGLAQALGEDSIFWSADQAIVDAERRGCPHCLARAQAESA